MSGTSDRDQEVRDGRRDTVHDLAGPYALDAVDESERQRFEAHLAGCEDCRRTVTAFRETTVDLSGGLEEQPPDRLRERLLAAVAQEPQQPAQERPRPTGERAAGAQHTLTEKTGAGDGAVTPFRPRRPVPSRRWWIAAAAAAAVAAGGVVVAQWGQDEPGAGVAVQQVLEAEDAQWSTETVDGSTVHVVRSEDLQRTVLVAEEMPEAPEGQDYQLWYVHEDGTAVSAGLMPRDGEERTEVVLEGDPAGAVAVGVTVEPAGGSPQPTSDPLVAVPLEG